jgi:glycosyltransferase involved in cell wall biosynthesis
VRVLCLTPELPHWPGGTGGATRQFFLLRRLVERGHDVEVVAPIHPSQREGAERLRAAGVRLRGAERPPSRVLETLRALRARPGLAPAALREPLLAWQVDVFWTALRPLAAQAIAERRPDVVLVEHDWAAGWARDLEPDIPRALTLHNLSFAYYRARARAASGPAAAALRLEARRFARHDRAHLARYGLLLTMSEDDRAAVRAVSTVRAEVVPNGVDTASMATGPAPDAPELLFTGTLSYPPNAEALVWLLEEVWPRVRAQVPDARLRVVGRGAPERARALADDHVELAGWVEDIVPWYDRAAVVLAPMLSGGGTRLKILDALASGRALVTTAAGAEGIPLVSGEHALIADGADAFAGAVVRTLRDGRLRARLGSSGRRLAETRYDWAAIGDRLAELLAGLAAGRAS